MKIKDLIRPEVLNLKPYIPATKVLDKVRLNANESPYSVTRSASKESLNLYPDARPDEIRNTMARYLDISSDNIVITRGSTEAIDVAIRTFCIPNKDEYWYFLLHLRCINFTLKFRELRCIQSSLIKTIIILWI